MSLYNEDEIIEEGVDTKKRNIIILVSITLIVIISIIFFYTYKLKTSLKIDDNTQLKINDAWLSFDQQDYEKAIEEFKKIVELKPKVTVGYRGIAVSYFMLEDYENSVNYYLKAVNLKSGRKNPSLYKYLGVTYFELAYNSDKNYTKAVEYIQKSLELNPDDPLALNVAGSIQREKGNYDKMWFYYDKSLSIDDENPYTFDAIAFYYLYEKNFDDAISFFTKSLDKKPYNQFFGRDLTYSYYLTNEYDNVIEISNTFINNYTPNYYWFYKISGVSYIHKGQVDKAIPYLKKAVELAPQISSIIADNNALLALAYLKNQEYENAIGHFEIALNNSNIQLAYGGLSAAYYFLNDEAESEKFLNLYIDFNYPTHNEIGVVYSKQFYQLGQIYADNEINDKAITHLEKSLELYPDNIESKELLEKLKA